MLEAVTDRVLDSVHHTAERALFVTALLLERSLSQAYSILHASALIGGGNVAAPAAQRAWWDPKKGSAIVVWAAGSDQGLSNALALALASVRSRSSGSSRAGQPPYTVIVLLPESSNGLASLVGAWAKRKAKVTSDRSSDRSSRLDAHQKQVVRESNSWAWNLFGLGNLSLRFDTSPEPAEGHQHQPSGAQEGSTEYDGAKNDDTEHSSPARSDSGLSGRQPRRRALSLGGWSAQDVVGYGRDMLKGLRIGQTEPTGLGAVIPITVDTRTQSGLLHAQSTIHAYCMSHDLLLRAVIMLPSIMAGTGEGATNARRGKLSSPSSSATTGVHDSLATIAAQTQDYLSGDVGDQLSLLATLLPVLKNDGGRVIGLVPSALHAPSIVERTMSETTGKPTFKHNTSRTDAKDDSVSFDVTRKAVLEMWVGTRSILEAEGVRTSIVHMTPAWIGVAKAAPTKSKVVNEANSYRASVGGPQKYRRSLTSAARLLVRSLVCAAYPMLYGVPRKPCSQHASRTNDLRDERVTTQSESDLEDEEDPRLACPALLLDAVRSALMRSWPRKDYSVGLGPRLEGVWQCLPGHSWIGRQITEVLWL